jgi:serine/threonine protein kinase
MEYSVENLCGLLIRSKLLSPDDVKRVYQLWVTEAKEQAGSSSRFLRWLVAKQHLTDYQAGLLGKGYADDFFLNQYKILDRIGRGRMAGVYQAVHQLGQMVAIKVLPPSKAKKPDLLARFQREARLSLKLKHPNVVRSFQTSQVKDLVYIVMEYLDGDTLEEVLQRRKKLPIPEAVRIVCQALAGLQHIHEQGLIHRDLKPGNLMLIPAPVPKEGDSTLKATVKILDIGLGRQLFDENAPADDQLTTEGTILGTPDYLAPEQFRDPSKIDIRADLYSLGCVLYHCLTGQPPFPEPNFVKQMVRHATETPRPLKELNPSIPDGLQQIVNWLLAKDPSKRYPTPERAAQALQMFLTPGGAQARPIEEAPQMKRYLTWLETSGSDLLAAPAAAPAPVALLAAPVGPGAAPAPLAIPVAAPKDKEKRPSNDTGRKRHKQRDARPPAAPPIMPDGVRPQDIDVELVPMPAPTQPAARLGLSQRDWIILSIGAGVVVIAVLVGLILASTLR